MTSFLAILSRFRVALACSSLLLILLALPVTAEPALVRVALTSVHRAPSGGSERVTEVLLWDRVEVLERQSGWARVFVPEQYRTPRGYPGWIRSDHLVSGQRPDLSSVTVRSPSAALKALPEPIGKKLMTAYLGTRLPVAETREGWYRVHLPGQQATLWVAAEEVAHEEPVAQGRSVVEAAASLHGTPYLWGGMTERGVDCSGLVYTTYRLHGYTLPRDADQQFEVGTPVAKQDLQPGDLVFFGANSSDITHVGIYRGDHEFVHASSRSGVAAGSLLYGYYSGRFQGARRIVQPGLRKLQVETP